MDSKSIAPQGACRFEAGHQYMDINDRIIEIWADEPDFQFDQKSLDLYASFISFLREKGLKSVGETEPVHLFDGCGVLTAYWVSGSTDARHDTRCTFMANGAITLMVNGPGYRLSYTEDLAGTLRAAPQIWPWNHT